MYASVREWTISESFKLENQHRVHDELLTLARTLPGFIDLYLMNSDRGTCISFGLFKDKKSADAFKRIANDFARDLGHHNMRLSSSTEGPVVVQSRTPAVV